MIQLTIETKEEAGSTCTGNRKSSVLLTVTWILIWFSLVVTYAYAENGSQDAGGDDTAQQQVEAVVVTGSRTPTVSAEKMTVPVQVVTGEDLKEIGAISLGQALEAVQGVELLESPDLNAAPGALTLRMRGMDTKHVLVLINGRRLPGTRPDSRGNSFTDISGINISDIERIEVLRDGAAAQYGSDAVAGVINIVMRKYNPRLSINTQYGLSSRWDAEEKQIEMSGGIPVGERLFLNVSANHHESDHYDRVPDSAIWTTPDVDQTGGSLKFSLDPTDSQAVDGELRYNQTETFMRITDDNATKSPRYRTSDKEDIYSGLTWSGEFETFRFESGLGLGWSDTEYRHKEDPKYRGDVETDVQNAFFHMNWEVRPWLTFFAGASADREDVDAPYRNFDESRTTYALFAESSMTFFDRLVVQLSGRIERYSDYGTNVAPKISASYEWSKNLSFRTSASSSFQVPTLYQLHDFDFLAMSDTVLINGDPDLEPAKGVNINFGATWTPFGSKGLKLSADLYRNDIDNKIAAQSLGERPYTKKDGTVITPQFINYINEEGTSSFTGVELEASMPLPWGFQLTGMAGYLKAEKPNGKDWPNRPRSRLNLTLNYNFNDRLRANLRYVYRGKYLDDVYPNTRIEPFDYINAQVTYALTPKISIFAGGRNLLDESPPLDLSKYETGHNESKLDSSLGAYYYGGVRLNF